MLPSRGISPRLPGPGVIARDIVEDLESALEQIGVIAEDLGPCP